jgi:glycosyltransferase involved in cell wall biosynthesis
MKILMFGWELPPQNSGGLGVACFNIAKALGEKDAEVIFVLPKKGNVYQDGFKVIFSNINVKVKQVDSLLSSYLTPRKYSTMLTEIEINDFYGNTLFEEVLRYGKEAKKIAESEQFDVIHAHDWLSFVAGVTAKEVSKKPLVVHIHATEFDRTGGGGVNQIVYDIEKWGMEKADKVIAVSQLTKNTIMEHYKIAGEKIEVVYNAHMEEEIKKHKDTLKEILKRPIVAFAGRITIQKGPDYFIDAAKRCLEYNPKIIFVMAGSGDMKNQMIEKVASSEISNNFLFEDFLRGYDVGKLYQAADLFVMPSVSEPFGLMALEAIQNGTPVLISKQMGAGELLTHCLKVDFWDTDEMASKILSVIEHKELKECLLENGVKNLSKFSWKNSAKKCIGIYKNIINSIKKNA